MRWLLPLVAMVSVAGARPIKHVDDLDDLKNPFATRRPPASKPRPDYIEPYYKDADCERSKKWSRVTACLRKSGKLSVLYELEGVKLVSLRYDATRDAGTLYLYVEKDKVWQRGNAYLSTNASSELLSFKRLEDRPGYRIDIGILTPTSAVLDEITSTKIVLLRKYTTVCGADAIDCRTVMTACDAFIRGKAYWSFRGAIKWEGRNVKVTGDATNGGKLCTPPKNVFAPIEDEL